MIENWRVRRRKHLWVSIGSDLRLDTRRDLDDVGAADVPVHALNKLPYGSLLSKVKFMRDFTHITLSIIAQQTSNLSQLVPKISLKC